MKNARPYKKAETSAEDRGNYTSTSKFTGTNNPRHLRALQVLLRRPIPREQLDQVVGCSNGPDLIAELRRRGLDIPCERIDFIDRDGKRRRSGVYAPSTKDRKLIYCWLDQRRRIKP